MFAKERRKTHFICLSDRWIIDISVFRRGMWALFALAQGSADGRHGLAEGRTQRPELPASGASTFRSSGGWGLAGWDSASGASSERMLQLSWGPVEKSLTQELSAKVKSPGVQETPWREEQSKGSWDSELKPALLIWLTNTSWAAVACPQRAKVHVDDRETWMKDIPLPSWSWLVIDRR